MGVNQDQFITTVANCFLRDTVSDAIVMKSKTLVNSNIAFNVQEQEIRGGEFNKLLYTYNFGRTGEITLEDARYEPALVALNCGQTIQQTTSNVYVFEEDVKLDASGNGTVTLKTPLESTKVYIQLPNKSIITRTFIGSQFQAGATYANQTVKVTYQYNETVDMITIDGDSFPKTYELVMEVKVFDADGLKEKVQWIFPAFKPSGNFEMPLAAETPTTSTMTGKVLDKDGVYGYKKTIPVSNSDATSYTAITADVAEITLDENDTYALTVYGLKGGLYAPVTFVASDCTFTSDADTIASVTPAGVISWVGEGDTTITIKHNISELTDIVTVTCNGTTG